VTIKNPLLEYLGRHPDGRFGERWLHYFDIYLRHFSPFRGRPITVVEIGIFNGASLPMWADYFGPQATIVGVDTNPECKVFAAPGIEIVIGDQGDRGFLRELAARYPDTTILIDDGGHQMHQQIATFEELYPRLAPQSVYLCEDTHTSYIPEFGGGFRKPNTFIEAMKPLIDKLNAFYSRDPAALSPDAFTLSTNSIHFYDSVVVIEKMPRSAPQPVTYGKEMRFRYVGPSIAR
jgi:hypothetical protein